MKKFIAIVLITLTMLSMTACVTKRTSEAVKGETSRMIEIEDTATATYYIVYDKYTKVMYAVSDGAHNHGTFTLLVDANGNPLLYNEAERSE